MLRRVWYGLHARRRMLRHVWNDFRCGARCNTSMHGVEEVLAQEPAYLMQEQPIVYQVTDEKGLSITLALSCARSRSFFLTFAVSLSFFLSLSLSLSLSRAFLSLSFSYFSLSFSLWMCISLET